MRHERWFEDVFQYYMTHDHADIDLAANYWIDLFFEFYMED